MILHLHHRYRTLGGEERAIASLRDLTEERLVEPTTLLERDSAELSGARAAAGLLRGGLDPEQVADEVRRVGARIVHAHNLHPTFGVRALRAARAAGAAVVLQLHNYRLVCAVGTCVRDGHDCTLCHGRDVRPGLRHRCRGGLAEGAAYAAGIARQQPGLLAAADVVVVPSRAALERLRALGIELPPERVHVLPHPVVPGPPIAPDPDGPAVVAGRLAAEKGTAVAIEAARINGRSLVIANDGPDEPALRAAAADLPQVRFAGRLDRAGLERLRATAALELVPSLAHETFGLAAAEAMLRGLPVVASDVGALRELVPDDARVPPGDPVALAAAWERLAGDAAAGARQRDAAARLTDPAAIADRLAAVYAAALGG
ncbi:glycosyltransferase family 4 protein [Patulibacter defluvii]|uniref:glycosyltransferase family 4 protein n=1 Tax=Patulibacter defluvii TaxID=3095358 RepID=UPI002A761DB1|nr:glycosyltransferase family 4 protein [Patulibacter sp. DM4]